MTSRRRGPPVAVAEDVTTDRPKPGLLGTQRSRLRGPLLLLTLVALSLAACKGRLWAAASQRLAETHGERSILHRLRGAHCLVDELLADEGQPGDAWVGDADEERFLIYSPQFGLGNQQITLRNAVVWALLLNRTLVLPRVLGHSGCSNESLCDASARESAAHGDVFEAAPTAPLRAEETAVFLRRGLRPRRLLVLSRVRARWAFRMRDDYWASLNLSWHSAPLDVPMRRFDGGAIRSTFGACTHHRVLAFRSLFAALEVPADGYPPPGRRWLDSVAMPALYQPSAALRALVRNIVASLRAVPDTAAPGTPGSDGMLDGGAPGPRYVRDTARRQLACAHIRLGDILEDCERYRAESAAPDGRAWVKAHFDSGYACALDAKGIASNLRALLDRMIARLPPNGPVGVSSRDLRRRVAVVYAAVEDAAVLRHPALGGFNLSSLSSFAPMIAAAALPLPARLAAVLLDQMVCAQAEHLLLNVFSTFSQVPPRALTPPRHVPAPPRPVPPCTRPVPATSIRPRTPPSPTHSSPHPTPYPAQMLLTRVGLDHAPRVGWTRELDEETRRGLGLDVQYWRG